MSGQGKRCGPPQKADPTRAAQTLAAIFGRRADILECAGRATAFAIVQLAGELAAGAGLPLA